MELKEVIQCNVQMLARVQQSRGWLYKITTHDIINKRDIISALGKVIHVKKFVLFVSILGRAIVCYEA